jgi:hypothetical protein
VVDEEKTEREGHEKKILSAATLQQISSFIVSGDLDQDSERFKSFHRMVQEIFNC